MVGVYFKTNTFTHLQENIFRYFYFFAVFVRWAKSVTGIRNEESSDQLNMEGRNTEYWETLERLLDSKMQADYEETLQDDFADLGKDIMNFISANNIQNNAKLHARLVEIEQAISQRNIKGDSWIRSSDQNLNL